MTIVLKWDKPTVPTPYKLYDAFMVAHLELFSCPLVPVLLVLANSKTHL